MNGKWFISEYGMHKSGESIGKDITPGGIPPLYPSPAGNYLDPKMSARFDTWYKFMQHMTPWPAAGAQFDVRGIDMPVVIFIDKTSLQQEIYAYAVTPDRKSILQAYSWLLDETK